MTRDELAALLNGRAYRHEISREEEAQAKAAGLLVIFGGSDDLVEFRGAFHDEIGATNDTLFALCKDGELLGSWESLRLDDSDDPEAEAARYFARKALGFHEIAALWDQEGFSWVIKPAPLPHSTFVILDDEDNYCRGVVLDMAEVRGEAKAPAVAAAPALAYSTDGERYHLDTVADVVASLDYGRGAPIVGARYFVGERVDYSAADFFKGCVEGIVEHAQARADDEAGELAEGFANDVRPEAEAELEAFVTAWADKHLSVDFFTVKNTRELQLTAEDIERAKADDLAENADYLA